MNSRKKYIYNKLKKIGMSDHIINDLYYGKVSKEDIDTIINSNYPYDICRLFINKKFRELKQNKNTIIAFINESEKKYQAYYASLAAINDDVLDSSKILSIVYNITRSKRPEYAKVAYEVAIDKNILETKYPNIATAMACNGTKIEKIYDFINSDAKTESNNNKIIKNYRK